MTIKKTTKQEKRLCYVIMPFSKHAGFPEEEWTDVYDTIFKSAIEGSGFGYRCERSTITSGSFTQNIVEKMKNAHVVLADITGFNGNVMWELGVRHTFSPRTIMVSRNNINEKKVISDLGTYGVHFYENNGGAIKKFKKEIKDTLKSFETNLDKPDNPVLEFLKMESYTFSTFEQTLIIKKLTGLMSEFIEDLRIAEVFLSTKGTTKIPTLRFSVSATDHFLYENYVNISDDFQDDCYFLKKWITACNVGFELLAFNVSWSEKTRKDNYDIIKDNVKTTVERLNLVIPKMPDIISQIKNEPLSKSIPRVIIKDKKHLKFLKS